jgi:repressor LexA
MQTITPKQQQILSAIRAHIRATGQSPTIREIGTAVSLRSSCSVQKQVEALETAGKICRTNFKYRSIEIVGDAPPRPIDHSNSPIPIMGRAAGGSPLEAMQDLDPEIISIPSSLLIRFDENRQQIACDEQKYFEAPLFGLRVVGRSMIDVGIDDGDLVVVKRQSTASNGEIVVAIVDNESATVKKFYREDNCIRLEPANEAFSPIYSENVQVLGKVTLAIKQF